MIRRPPRSTLSSSSAASDVYKRQEHPVAVQRLSVRDSAGPRDTRAGRGDGREANLLEDPGGPGVPGVGEHEAGACVQGKEGGCLIGRRSGCHERTASTSACDTPLETWVHPDPRSKKTSARAGRVARAASVAAASYDTKSSSGSPVSTTP